LHHRAVAADEHGAFAARQRVQHHLVHALTEIAFRLGVQLDTGRVDQPLEQRVPGVRGDPQLDRRHACPVEPHNRILQPLAVDARRFLGADGLCQACFYLSGPGSLRKHQDP
jgi:hypothetical protein